MSVASFLNAFGAPPLPSYQLLVPPSTTIRPYEYVTEQVVLSPILTVYDSVDNDDSDGEFRSWEEFDEEAYDRDPGALDADNKDDKGENPKVKRQTTNGRPVNVFGLGFGTNQRPGESVEHLGEERPHGRPVSNSEVTFGKNHFEKILKNNEQAVMDAAVAQASEGSQSQGEGVEELRKKRQTTNGRPVNIFGLGFGTNVVPGRGQPQQQPQVSNSDVTFDENKLDELLRGAMSGLADSALKQTQASPEELIKTIEGMDLKSGLTKKEDPVKTIIAPHSDLIFHPDVTDVLMLMLGILFFAVFIPGLVGFVANFVPQENWPVVLLPRPTLNG